MAAQDQTRPPQTQSRQPGLEHEMAPEPQAEAEQRAGSGKLWAKNTLITGGDSGIGRAVAVQYAREGADVAISYLDEDADAAETVRLVQAEGGRCLSVAGDVADPVFCADLIAQVVEFFGPIDVLVNNAAEQHVHEDVRAISQDQLERTFATNVFSMFYLVQAALPHLTENGCIINSTSVTAYQGKPELIDYSATKGAIVSLTRALSNSLVGQGIRVNAVAPGPIWTPLIPASFPAEQVEAFGADTPMGRPGEPEEVAPSYVFLASQDASYISGQVLHPNGGQVVNG